VDLDFKPRSFLLQPISRLIYNTAPTPKLQNSWWMCLLDSKWCKHSEERGHRGLGRLGTLSCRDQNVLCKLWVNTLTGTVSLEGGKIWTWSTGPQLRASGSKWSLFKFQLLYLLVGWPWVNKVILWPSCTARNRKFLIITHSLLESRYWVEPQKPCC
jgi:hypothetical protein